MHELALLVHNIDGIQDPVLHPASIKNSAVANVVKRHHVAVLLETRTNALDRLMLTEHLQDTHRLVHAVHVPDNCLGRKGYGVAVITANACADLISVYHVSEDLQCVWLLCNKHMFGLEDDVMLCAVYLNPSSIQNCVDEMYSTFADELSYAAQVTENLVLCGDFNAHVGDLSEVSDFHGSTLVAVPALHEPRRVQRKSNNKAGRLLVDLAAVFKCIIATGRSSGDDGQPTCFKEKGSSRPDHILLSPKMFEAVHNTRIDKNERPDQCDHCAISMVFWVKDTCCSNVDWSLKKEHVCKPGGCGTKLSLKWKPERAHIYAHVLLENKEIQEQFKQAVVSADVEKACFCVRAMVEHAASDPRVGMAKHVNVCASLRPKRAHRPPWFDAECMAKRRALLNAVQTGQAVNACKFLRKQFRQCTRCAKRTYNKYQKALFLDRMHRKDPELHAMLRQRKRAQQTPLSSKAWEEYLASHFQAPASQQSPPMHTRVQCRVDARDMAVPLGRKHAPPEVLLSQGAECAWVPEPDVVNMPDLATVHMLLAEQIKKMNVRASSGFDLVSAPFIKQAVILHPVENGRSVRVNVLLPYLAELFKLMMDKACVPACWKQAKLSPLYKKGPLLNPNSYRMLAVSGTMYRLYANVVRCVVTNWCADKNKIPDTQFGFYPGRSTLHPMFILRHLRHTARRIKPYNNSPRLHAAFIDFKQAYDTIPRAQLWQHLKRTSIPAPLLSIIQSMYEQDAYVLMDGSKSARVQPNRGVKQGCPLSPLLFSLYVNDIGKIAEDCKGAVTGTDGVNVTHMLYADDSALFSHDPAEMQKMLNRLSGYAQKKSLIINVQKSEVVCFNGKGTLPVFKLNGEELANKDTFKYLGMHFTKTVNLQEASARASQPFLAAAYRVREFVRSHALGDRPHSYLWLAKTYAVPAGMYASQVWGTPFMKKGTEFTSVGQKCHLNFLKGILGVKRTTCNWAVLRECGHETLQFYWFRAAIKFYNSMLNSNSEIVRKVLKADCALRARDNGCWTAQLIEAFRGLRNGEAYERAVIEGRPVPMIEFVADLRFRHQEVWRAIEGNDPREQPGKLTTYQAWFASPLVENTRFAARLPRYLYLDLPKHVIRNISRFRLRAHTLRVESGLWQNRVFSCDRCDCQDIQDEKHVLFYCKDARACALRQKYMFLFDGLFATLQAFANEFQPFLSMFHQVSNQDVFDFLNQPNNKIFIFLSELMDVFMMAGSVQQTDEPNDLAQGQTPL